MGVSLGQRSGWRAWARATARTRCQPAQHATAALRPASAADHGQTLPIKSHRVDGLIAWPKPCCQPGCQGTGSPALRVSSRLPGAWSAGGARAQPATPMPHRAPPKSFIRRIQAIHASTTAPYRLQPASEPQLPARVILATASEARRGHTEKGSHFPFHAALSRAQKLVGSPGHPGLPILAARQGGELHWKLAA